MKTALDSGHLVNVNNFTKLIMNCSSFDGNYKPINSALLLPNLQEILKQASECMEANHTAQVKLSNAILARETAFKPLSKLVTRVGNAVTALATSAVIEQQIKPICRKLHGQRLTIKKTEEEKNEALKNGSAQVKISTSQMSFNNRIENLNILIKALVSIPEYTPNEKDLQVNALIEFHQDLKNRNIDVINADIELNNLRIRRNELLYKEITGLTYLAQSVKMYIKSVYGATSPQFKQISSLKFTHGK